MTEMITANTKHLTWDHENWDVFICFQFILHKGSIHDCLYYNTSICLITFMIIVMIVFCVQSLTSGKLERATSIASRLLKYLKFGQHTVTCLLKVYQIPNCDKYKKLCSSNMILSYKHNLNPIAYFCIQIAPSPHQSLSAILSSISSTTTKTRTTSSSSSSSHWPP